jgi:hypothetical protein
MQVQELHCLCANDLLQDQVFTYPPLSLAFFFNEKKLKHDKVFESLMLPFV